MAWVWVKARRCQATVLGVMLPRIAVTCSINALKFSNVSDCAPSDFASSGFGCTSMIRPSAAAARASGVTRYHRPVPWLGVYLAQRADDYSLDPSVQLALEPPLAEVLHTLSTSDSVPRAPMMTIMAHSP